MFGGYIQSGVYRTLDGKAGLPGWRWIFVIDFIITIPIAILGYLVIPDSPTQAKPNKFLSQKDLDFCAERVRVIKKVEIASKFNLKVVKKMLTSWQFYVFTFYYTVGHLPDQAAGYWAIVLKAQGYNLYQRNNLPTSTSAFNVVACVVGGLLVDVIGRFWEVMTVAHTIWIIALSILVKWDVPRAAQFYAYITAGISGLISTLCCSWANEMTREDNQLRAAVLGALNLVNIGPLTGFSIKAFNTDYAPKFEEGTRISLGICIVSFFTGFVVLWFDRYQRRKRDYIEDQALEGKTEHDLGHISS
ncbi:Pantothenate transporter [Wickerhamomyces ciferrii]|uniref:Pantothenate transporter n=1 Tax=Wickerhamomyces ciferrii (strain ATCC 14091 / BCRC 22168 / CBS 111 / JCM 3599 / NBRC 0793 / NRRL Y-1031 F-60-10) TaxID=1206466 RepID=K0KR11_WICCF|nr:Pantothenate transporter [Wickerhamomyces ciferrii]CCH43734.1 Pantothenate transporter [Wickerhamomyces ciferrii]